MRQRLDPARLTEMALAALEEIAARCHLAPQPRSRSLALVLAYLASRRREAASRAAFDQFWRAIAKSETNTRWQSANGALNGIYLAVGEKRDLTITSIFEGEARAARGLGRAD